MQAAIERRRGDGIRMAQALVAGQRAGLDPGAAAAGFADLIRESLLRPCAGARAMAGCSAWVLPWPIRAAALVRPGEPTF